MSSLEVDLFGTRFQNPVLLASGTCGFGLELGDVVDLEGLGGFVTKSVTVEPRWGNPPPRVAEFGAGMLNSVGLANPGLDAVRRDKLPWLRSHVRRARVFVSVAGHTAEQYDRLVGDLDREEGFLGFELNLSCPNDTHLKGKPFALDREALQTVVSRCRALTERPILVKLAPNDPELEETARAAERSGADGLTLVNTIPGLALDPLEGTPSLGAGAGGVSGRALRPVGVRAVTIARAATSLPLAGVGGIGSADDALQYLRAGASLVQVGTASFADPRSAERIVRDLERLALQGRLPRTVAPGDARGRGAGRPGASAELVEDGVSVAREVPWPR